ncbi:hypothetical protein Lal_00015847, partial [Lupinus albus]
MTIIRDIVSDFSDEDEIELCGDDEEEDDVEIGSSELNSNITHATPSCFFTYTNSEVGRDYRPRLTTLRNDNDLFVWMQFESKESTLDAIKQFHIRSSIYLAQGHFEHYKWKMCAKVKIVFVFHLPPPPNSVLLLPPWKARSLVLNSFVRPRSNTYLHIHCCCQDHTKLNTSFISNCIINLVSEDLALVKEIVSHFGYIVTYRKVWIVKQLAMSRIYGEWKGSDNALPRWMNVVQNFASGTIVRYEASRHFVVGIEDPISFSYCKPILQVDGTFLIGKYTGTLLIASSQDGNKRIFLLAFAIVEEETKEAWDCWLYFVLNYKNGVILKLLYCVCHLASNFNKEFRDFDLKDKVIQMGYELMRPRFEQMLSDQIPKAKWTQCYDEGRQYRHMTTNLADCINGSKALPIISLVRSTYYRLKLCFVDHRDEVVNMMKGVHVYCKKLTN